MERPVIKAERRTVIGKQVGALRRQGKLPGVIYGHHVEATPITMDQREASRILAHASASTLVTIQMDGQEHAALVRERQRDYLRGSLLHVDFQAVSLTEKIRTQVSVVLTGTAPAIKDQNGVVVAGLDSLTVEGLPQDLPERFEVDLGSLVAIGDGLYVRDVKASPKVEILDSPDEMIAVITLAKEEVEEPAAVVEEEPEVIERGKKEEEEGEEE
jgi:large subunit ribosomal protein L25